LINIQPETVIIHMVLFLVMVYVVLNPILFKPMLRVMDERKKRIDGNLEAAKVDERESERLRRDYEQKLDDAKKTAVQEKEKIKKAAEKEEEKIIREAREKAGDLVAEVREKISLQYKEARESLRAESEAMGKEIAQKILGRPV